MWLHEVRKHIILFQLFIVAVCSRRRIRNIFDDYAVNHPSNDDFFDAIYKPKNEIDYDDNIRTRQSTKNTQQNKKAKYDLIKKKPVKYEGNSENVIRYMIMGFQMPTANCYIKYLSNKLKHKPYHNENKKRVTHKRERRSNDQPLTYEPITIYDILKSHKHYQLKNNRHFKNANNKSHRQTRKEQNEFMSNKQIKSYKNLESLNQKYFSFNFKPPNHAFRHKHQQLPIKEKLKQNKIRKHQLTHKVNENDQLKSNNHSKKFELTEPKTSVFDYARQYRRPTARTKDYEQKNIEHYELTRNENHQQGYNESKQKANAFRRHKRSVHQQNDYGSAEPIDYSYNFPLYGNGHTIEKEDNLVKQLSSILATLSTEDDELSKKLYLLRHHLTPLDF